MNNVDISFRLKELSDEIKQFAKEFSELKKNNYVDELWDNADMVRNWKLSPRTLASWRSEGTIGFVQVGGKIWYTKAIRDEFLKANMIKVGGDK